MPSLVCKAINGGSWVSDGRVMVLRVSGPTTMEIFTAYATQVPRMRASKLPIALVVSLSTGFTTPPAQIREVILKRTNVLEPTDRIQIVVGGTGMWPSIQRTVIEGLAIAVGNKRSRVQFSSDLDQAIRSACAFTGDSSDRLLAAVHEEDARSATPGALTLA